MKTKHFHSTLILILTFFCCPTLKAQELSTLLDSCYIYIENNDMNSFNQQYIKILDAYEKEYDAELYSVKKELIEMRVKDQSIRLLYMDAQQKKKPTDKIRKIMESIDNANAQRVTEIIDKHGWLSSEDIGSEANEALFLCIQHSQDSILQHKYLPILKEAVLRKAAEGWQYAFLTDRTLMNQGKEQVYGTQRIRRNGIYYLVPVQDIDQIDNLRKEIGMEPLHEYMEDASLEKPWSTDFYKENVKLHQSIFQSWYEKQQKKK